MRTTLRREPTDPQGAPTPVFVVVGPTPPPIHGVAAMTLEIIRGLGDMGRLGAHVDTSDRRPLDTIGRLDVTNVFLAVKHSWRLSRTIAHQPNAIVYIPLSQGRWGFVRDTVFVAIAKLHARRVILHLHGGYFKNFYLHSSVVLRWLVRFVLGQAHEVWALTPSLQSQFAGLVDDELVRCVENVVPDPLAGADLSPWSAPPSSRFRLLYLANLLPEKGCFDLLAALALLGRAGRDWDVRVVGPAAPDVSFRIQREVARLPADGPSVQLLGQSHGTEKHHQYQWADAFVYPTFYPFEGQPLVLLEALGAGLPIVSTWHAGIPETVRHDIEGLLVAPRDVEGLAAALRRLAEEDATRTRFAHAARARYESAYAPGRLSRDLTAALARLSDSRRYPDGPRWRRMRRALSRSDDES